MEGGGLAGGGSVRNAGNAESLMLGWDLLRTTSAFLSGDGERCGLMCVHVVWFSQGEKYTAM